VDEIGAAKREWTSIYGSKDEVKAKFKKLEELSRMMRQVSRTGLEPYPYPYPYPSPTPTPTPNPTPDPSPNLIQHGARGAHPSTELAALTSRWEELELTLDAFNERIEDQMQHLRGQVRVRVRLGSTLTLTLTLT